MLMLRAACLLVFTLALPVAAEAQSFNCRYARAPDEVAICQNDRLSGLDQLMARVYSRIRNNLEGSERQQLEADQRDWLAERRDCGSDTDCIAESYERRIRVLRQY